MYFYLLVNHLYYCIFYWTQCFLIPVSVILHATVLSWVNVSCLSISLRCVLGLSMFNNASCSYLFVLTTTEVFWYSGALQVGLLLLLLLLLSDIVSWLCKNCAVCRPDTELTSMLPTTYFEHCAACHHCIWLGVGLMLVWEDYRIGPPPKVHLSVSIPCKKV